MPRALLFVLLSLVGCVSFAQSSGLYFERTFVERELPAGLDDVAAVGHLVNPTNVDIEVVWIREVNDLPRGWRSGVCDTNDCYVERSDSAFFTIPAGSTSPIIPHIYATRATGDAQVTVRAVNLSDRRDNAVVTFRFAEAKQPVSSGTRLFPNPGSEVFRVATDQAISGITLTNMLGKVVREFPAYQSSYDVRDLPDGIYLATLIGVDGRVVKTLRYSKRAIMP